MRNTLTGMLFMLIAAGGLGFMTPVMADQHGMGQMHNQEHAGDWKASLNDKQREDIAKLKLSYKQKAIPLKLRIKQARVDLALLISADNPDNKAIDKKIDEIVKLKAEKMRLKADYKISVRKQLTASQRVQFDMKMLKKAAHGKKCGKKGRGHH